jgi:hypothetical protein
MWTQFLSTSLIGTEKSLYIIKISSGVYLIEQKYMMLAILIIY